MIVTQRAAFDGLANNNGATALGVCLLPVFALSLRKLRFPRCSYCNCSACMCARVRVCVYLYTWPKDIDFCFFLMLQVGLLMCIELFWYLIKTQNWHQIYDSCSLAHSLALSFWFSFTVYLFGWHFLVILQYSPSLLSNGKKSNNSIAFVSFSHLVYSYLCFGFTAIRLQLLFLFCFIFCLAACCIILGGASFRSTRCSNCATGSKRFYFFVHRSKKIGQRFCDYKKIQNKNWKWKELVDYVWGRTETVDCRYLLSIRQAESRQIKLIYLICILS